jgi:hypothetical protein
MFFWELKSTYTSGSWHRLIAAAVPLANIYWAEATFGNMYV